MIGETERVIRRLLKESSQEMIGTWSRVVAAAVVRRGWILDIE